MADKDDRNGNSLVTLIEYDDFRIIFTGDAEKVTEEAIMANFPNITATVTTGSHHGARTHGSNHIDWVNRIQARAVIYTSGVNYGHPTCESNASGTDHLRMR
ncbi:MAG: hypothetical protein U5O39_09935 [Gammaproteobacteria bacterium]|nr:hypothetical protein [Gammaproteobacteria bacterium]